MFFSKISKHLVSWENPDLRITKKIWSWNAKLSSETISKRRILAALINLFAPAPPHPYEDPCPWVTSEFISFNGQGQLCHPTTGGRSLLTYQNKHDSVKEAEGRRHKNLVKLTQKFHLILWSFLFPTEMKLYKCLRKKKKGATKLKERKWKVKVKTSFSKFCFLCMLEPYFGNWYYASGTEGH